jgi:hypothetical protein
MLSWNSIRTAQLNADPWKNSQADSSSPLVSFINAMNFVTSAIAQLVLFSGGVPVATDLYSPLKPPFNVQRFVSSILLASHPPLVHLVHRKKNASLGTLLLLPLVTGVTSLFAFGKIVAAAAGGGAFFVERK